jgi:hypothetical protein
MFFIGRSPTQLVLCHTLNAESKLSCKDILKYFSHVIGCGFYPPFTAHLRALRGAWFTLKSWGTRSVFAAPRKRLE